MAQLYQHLLLLLSIFSVLCTALKFDIQAQPSGARPRCIRNFVAKDTLVVVTATVSGTKGDGQRVNIHIRDGLGNDYGRPKNVVGESRTAFTPHNDVAFDVCFENILEDEHAAFQEADMPAIGQHYGPLRSIELDVEIGADARDWNAIQAAEKLKPLEMELRRVEAIVGEVVNEMEYLRRREQKLRDTNESTNERVKWFAIAVMGTLVGVGSWQVMYLRSYFRSKHLI
ncbi:emp24/gp25L/p24 family/GOLD-domain-containing protein [Kalaharituber pfeilii]|nr:emp24/gp25L/p24 family/GOLD-domain-containing protein [Kalaharituber pfeilii]